MRATRLLLVAMLAACSKENPVQPTQPVAVVDAGRDVEETIAAASRSNLTAFASDEELTTFFDDLAKAQKARAMRHAGASNGAEAQSAPQASAAAADDKAKDESITNTQEANVDEGGIVKAHGDFLVVLRRGRLFTVRVGDDSLRPVSHADAFGAGIDPSGSWYDEMLISGDTVVVVGYSYQRGGTEIGLFDLDGAGKITYRATYHLRSNDYYSSRNYASRIVGNKLVFYSPMYLPAWGGAEQAERALPALRRWHTGATDAEFQRIVAPTSIYRPVTGFGAQALHTVTVCDLGHGDMTCKATTMMGPMGRTFYVSEKAVYVWMSDWTTGKSKSMLARMPLDGGGPSALVTMGAPVDQFSFAERADQLDVLVRSDSGGDAMWAPETAAGDVALLRLPIASFSTAVTDVPKTLYTSLPKPTENAWAFQNRFVGDWLLYGTGMSWGYAHSNTDKTLVAYHVSDAQAAPAKLELAHGVDRIEAMGKNAVVVGSDGSDLHFTAIALGANARTEGHFVRAKATQGETRSQGFFYKVESDDEGMLGLPIRGAAKPGWSQLVEGSASIVFVKNRALDFQSMGELEASGRAANDACRASCVDWYGNARPIFLHGRIFALMGYEIVEGKLDAGRVLERRRIDFAPGAPAQL
ncbi:MAG TPA: beta-propeller domain-containing protein [Polyangiaceae bacterium]